MSQALNNSCTLLQLSLFPTWQVAWSLPESIQEHASLVRSSCSICQAEGATGSQAAQTLGVPFSPPKKSAARRDFSLAGRGSDCRQGGPRIQCHVHMSDRPLPLHWVPQSQSPPWTLLGSPQWREPALQTLVIWGIGDSGGFLTQQPHSPKF